jgi:hypothetical protein
MKNYIAVLFAMLFVGCKSTQAVVKEGNADETMAATKIIDGHYADKKDFKTLYIKASAKYEDAKDSQNVTAEIRIEKDKRILVSIRYLGITVAKAMITPTEVSYYEKINASYFKGDYAALSQWLGTELDFEKVQNLLIGQSLDNLSKGKYKASIEEKLYKLEETSDKDTQKIYYFEAENFLVKKEEVRQTSKNRSLEVNYPNHTKYDATFLPAQILLEATQSKGKTKIDINYNSATFNEELSFPYSIPEGYERQFID